MREVNGVSTPRGSPTYRREYRGDVGSLVYPYSHNFNRLLDDKALPEQLAYVLGVDIGFTDATAFVVAAIAPRSPYIYIVEAMKDLSLPS